MVKIHSSLTLCFNSKLKLIGFNSRHFCIRPEECPEVWHCQYEAHGCLLAVAQITFIGLCWSWSKTYLQTPCLAGLNKMFWSRSCQGKMNCSYWRNTNPHWTGCCRVTGMVGAGEPEDNAPHKTGQDLQRLGFTAWLCCWPCGWSWAGRFIVLLLHFPTVWHGGDVMGWFPLPKKSKPIWDWLVDISIHCCSYTSSYSLGQLNIFSMQFLICSGTHRINRLTIIEAISSFCRGTFSNCLNLTLMTHGPMYYLEKWIVLYSISAFLVIHFHAGVKNAMIMYEVLKRNIEI